jgi:hypothetical protein
MVRRAIEQALKELETIYTTEEENLMLIQINNTIINTANIVSAHFAPATGQAKERLQIFFVNNLQTADSTGTISLEGDEAAQAWKALCQKAESDRPKPVYRR